MERLGGGHELAVPLDPVLVAEAGAANADAAQVDREDVVEARRGRDSRRVTPVVSASIPCAWIDRYPPAWSARYATRATSSQTTYDAWWAMPCASVSAKRTRMS